MFLMMSLICYFLPAAPAMEQSTVSLGDDGQQPAGGDDCPDWKVLSPLCTPRLQPFYGPGSDYRMEVTQPSLPCVGWISSDLDLGLEEVGGVTCASASCLSWLIRGRNFAQKLVL